MAGIDQDTGEPRIFQGRRCRACGHDYDDLVVLVDGCKAPRTAKSQVEDAMSAIAAKNMDPNQIATMVEAATKRKASRTPEEKEKMLQAQRDAAKRLGVTTEDLKRLPDKPETNPAPGVEEVDPMKDILG